MKKYIGLVLVAMSGCILTVNAQQSFSYKNPLLPTELRVNDLLGRMTLEEKIAQIRHLHSWDVFDGQILNQDRPGFDVGHGNRVAALERGNVRLHPHGVLGDLDQIIHFDKRLIYSGNITGPYVLIRDSCTFGVQR